MQIFLAKKSIFVCIFAKKNSEMTYFGTNLKKIRQIKGLSQQAFAELIDLNRGVISSYEEGRAEPKIDTLLRIATYFGISTDDIISKPLTVNQLSNFSLIEDSFTSMTEEKPLTINTISAGGETENCDVQKILAHFDCVFFVDDQLANNSNFEKNSVLFLKKADAKSNHNHYLIIENGKAHITSHYSNHKSIYAVVGMLGKTLQSEQNSILERLILLEKKVFGK